MRGRPRARLIRLCQASTPRQESGADQSFVLALTPANPNSDWVSFHLRSDKLLRPNPPVAAEAGAELVFVRTDGHRCAGLYACVAEGVSSRRSPLSHARTQDASDAPGYFDREAANLLTKFRRGQSPGKAAGSLPGSPCGRNTAELLARFSPFPISHLVAISNVEANHHSKATAHFRVGTAAKSDVLSQ